MCVVWVEGRALTRSFWICSSCCAQNFSRDATFDSFSMNRLMICWSEFASAARNLTPTIFSS